MRIGSESAPLYTGDAFGMLFLGNIVMPSTTIVARDVIERTGFFDESFHVAEDTEYFHRVAAHSPLTVLMEPLTAHRIGHPSLVAEKSDRLIQNAIRSVERAATLRPSLTSREHLAFREGSRMLRVRMAYARLAALDPRGARNALRTDSGKLIISRRSLAIIIVSLLPRGVLRALHKTKRVVFAWRR
jgi:GT2 family glycosyltransferase